LNKTKVKIILSLRKIGSVGHHYRRMDKWTA